jgi:hypothetical protein
MKFEIFDHIERRDDVGLAQLYEERLQLMERADEAGVYSYHIAVNCSVLGSGVGGV